MGNNLLKGKKGIIFGALDEKSIAWKTASQCFAEGAQLVLTNAPVALRMGVINKLAEQCGNAPVIGADVTNMDDLKKLFEESLKHFGGGIDFILRTQQANGFWSDPEFNAPGFPRVFYLKYHGYDKYFPLLALARYRNLTNAES